LRTGWIDAKNGRGEDGVKFSTRQDIEAPVDRVFAALGDFAAFERAALRRGAEITRLDGLPEPGPGMAWAATFPWRGKARQVRCALHDYTPPESMRFQAEGDGITLTLLLGLMALSRGRSRLGVELELRPLTLTARLMLQTARLGKTRLTRRFEARVAAFALRVETEAGSRQAMR
jgi:uncharacterized protein YndB with AHSA1/START domain